ncbi:hypothetical protein [Gymnodinialimonas sp. 57CJ19]|uniref:hypothetical protein n=1 Tax=Gymnodinialimonas sp. 57CJ19 TaxID=3138498 RepID=UPI0031342555
MTRSGLTEEDISVVAGVRLRDYLWDSGASSITIDLLNATDIDGWCFMTPEGRASAVFMDPQTLIEQGGWDCMQLAVALLAHTTVVQSELAMQAAWRVGGLREPSEMQSNFAAQMIALGQAQETSFFGGSAAEEAVEAALLQLPNFPLDQHVSYMLREHGAPEPYDSRIVQSLFFDVSTGASAFLYGGADSEAMPQDAFWISSGNWDVFDPRDIEDPDFSLPSNVVALSEYESVGWALESTSGLSVVLRNRYVNSNATRRILELVHAAQLQLEYLPPELRFLFAQEGEFQ